MNMNAAELRAQHRIFWTQKVDEDYPRLNSYARHLCRNDQASDLVHDVVYRVLKYAPDPKLIKNTTNYLLRAVRNAWFDRIRAAKKAELISYDDPSNEELRFALVATERDMSIDLDNERMRDAMKVVLRRLSPRERRLLTLYLEGLKCKEIAAELGEDARITSVDLNAVKSKVRYRIEHMLH